MRQPLPSITTIGLAITILLTVSSMARAQNPKTGEFEIAFTERSPISTKDEIRKRLIDVPDSPDYDLSKEPFRVYVPQNYDPAVKHGVIVWLNYKSADSTPPRWKPVLDDKHLIFIVARSNDQPEWVRAGLTLDAVHNLKKQYSIDDDRVYLFGTGNQNQYTMQRIGFAAPDVFRGFLYAMAMRYFRPIPVPGRANSSYPAVLPRPQGPLLAQAKTRRHVFAPNAADPAFGELVANAYQQDGFDKVMVIPVSIQQDIHYPDLSTPWLEKALTFFDAPSESAPRAAAPTVDTPSAAAPVRPATRPAVAESQRMLNLAKSLITARSYPPARTRLQEIITKYPNDPAAKEAKTLLDSIKDR